MGISLEFSHPKDFVKISVNSSTSYIMSCSTEGPFIYNVQTGWLHSHWLVINKLLVEYSDTCSLHSNSGGLLKVPPIFFKSFGDWTFAKMAALLWNYLQRSVGPCDTASSFKTHLFKIAFSY